MGWHRQRKHCATARLSLQVAGAMGAPATRPVAPEDDGRQLSGLTEHTGSLRAAGGAAGLPVDARGVRGDLRTAYASEVTVRASPGRSAATIAFGGGFAVAVPARDAFRGSRAEQKRHAGAFGFSSALPLPRRARALTMRFSVVEQRRTARGGAIVSPPCPPPIRPAGDARPLVSFDKRAGRAR